MKRFYFQLLLFIFLVSAFETSASNYDDYEDYGYNYSEYEDESEESTEVPTQASEIHSTTDHIPPSTSKSTSTEATPPLEKHAESKCPESCECSKTLDRVDCSNKNLKQIPRNLPYNTVQLNISQNSLTTFDVNALLNCKELRQVYLSDNRIVDIINFEGFSKLPSLHHIDLSSNQLKSLKGNEFSNAQGLLTLILRNNTEILSTNNPIVQSPKLRALDLRHCNITKLPDNTFQNVTSLMSLDMSDNPLKLDGNMNAFKYLFNLRMLSIPTVKQKYAKNLCKSLDVIDIIHLTSEHYDLSCFILETTSIFAESTIRNDLYKVATDPPSFNDPSNTTDDSNESDGDEIVILGTNKMNDEMIQTSYEKMCLIYMLLAGLLVFSLIGLLVSFCMLGTHRFGREFWYRRQNYQKYYSENIATDNGHFENILIENVEKQ